MKFGKDFPYRKRNLSEGSIYFCDELYKPQSCVHLTSRAKKTHVAFELSKTKLFFQHVPKLIQFASYLLWCSVGPIYGSIRF